MHKIMKWLFPFCFIIFLFGCGGAKEKATLDYKETKDLVLDILKTDEGKKAIHEASSSSGGNSDIVKTTEIQTTIEKSFSDPQNQKAFQEMLKDPKVAKAFAKAIEGEHKRLMKDMMKDPEYQQMMLKILNDPKSQESLLKAMNSTTYQQQTMSVMKDAMQSPMFRMEMIQLMVEAQKEMMKPENKKEEKKGGGEESGKGGGSQ